MVKLTRFYYYINNISCSNPVRTKFAISETLVKDFIFTAFRRIKVPTTKYNKGPINPRDVTAVPHSK